MKKHLILLLALLLTATLLIACNKPGIDDPAQTSGDPSSEETTVSADGADTAWPDNEFTKQIPKIDFAAIIAYTSDETNGFSVNIKDTDAEEIRAYIKAVKDAGFANIVTESDTQYGGFDVVEFEADNGSYTVKLGYTMNVATVSVSKKAA